MTKQKKATNQQLIHIFLIMLKEEFHIPDPIPEFRFALSINRQFRFDYAWPEQHVALEVDGGQYLPGGGRHNTDSDREKLNCAAMLGWCVFRATYQMLENNPFLIGEQIAYRLKEASNEQA